MKNFDKRNKKHEELEQRINDAVDGFLSQAEVRKLEEELKLYPDLLQDYEKMIPLQDLTNAYGENLEPFQNHLQVSRIQDLIEKEWEKSRTFEEIAVNWFRKYALAATLLVFGLTSLTHFVFPVYYSGLEEMEVPELLYPFEESTAEVYVIYLDELID